MTGEAPTETAPEVTTYGMPRSVQLTLPVMSPAGTATPFTVLPLAWLPTPDGDAARSIVIAAP